MPCGTTFTSSGVHLCVCVCLFCFSPGRSSCLNYFRMQQGKFSLLYTALRRRESIHFRVVIMEGKKSLPEGANYCIQH